MAPTKGDVAGLQAAVEKARQALAATENARAALLEATEPTSDLQAELKRVADLQTRQAAYERVIIAQRRELEAAEAALVQELGPVLRAELAQIESEVAAKVAEVANHLWAAHAIVEKTSYPILDRINRIHQLLRDGQVSTNQPAFLQLRNAENAVADALIKLGVAVSYAGPGGSGIRQAPTAAELAAERERQRQSNAEQLMAWEAKIQREAVRSSY